MFARVSRYLDHPDPLVRASNLIAMVVTANQPFYPLYVWWMVGENAWPTVMTFLSTPFFASVPAVSRHNPRLSRALLPATGIANTLLSMWALGEASGVSWFLVPCILIALLSFRPGEWTIAATLVAIALLAFTLSHGNFPAPLAVYTAEENQSLTRLNLISVACLCAFAAWTLVRARRNA